MEEYFNIKSIVDRDIYCLNIKDLKNLNDDQIDFFRLKFNSTISIITKPKYKHHTYIFKLLLTFDQINLLKINILEDVHVQFCFHKTNIDLEIDNWKINCKSYINTVTISIYQCEKYDNHDKLTKAICQYLNNYKIGTISFGVLDYFNCAYLQYISQINNESLNINRFFNINKIDSLCFPHVRYLSFINYFPDPKMFPNVTHIRWSFHKTNIIGNFMVAKISKELDIFSYYKRIEWNGEYEIYYNENDQIFEYDQFRKNDKYNELYNRYDEFYNKYINYLDYFPLYFENFANLNCVHLSFSNQKINDNIFDKLEKINKLYKLKLIDPCPKTIIPWLIKYFEDNDNIANIIVIGRHNIFAACIDDDFCKLLNLLSKKIYFNKFKTNMSTFPIRKYFKLTTNNKIFNLSFGTIDSASYTHIKNIILNDGYSAVKQLFKIKSTNDFYSDISHVQIVENSQKINHSLKRICEPKTF